MAHAHHKTDSHTVDFQVDPVVLELGQRFVDAGHELSLVGGPVRDLFLGRVSPDLDFTTDATPDQTVALIKKWADNYWEIGRAFGTIGMRKSGFQIEITTYRAEAYDPDSRKPVVAFGHSLTDDLLRRDFTINAMALRLPDLELVDPFGGVRDLHGSILATPGTPETSFSDDPLRMMRAARFAAQLGVAVHEDVRAAMTRMAERITMISAERVREELVKLICAAHPRAGVDLLVDTGLAEFVLPEVAALRLEADEHHRHKDVYQHSLQVLEQAATLETDADGAVPGPDFALRFAALMHDVGKPATRRFERGRRGELPAPRHGGLQTDGKTYEGAPLRQRHDQGGGPSCRVAHAVLRVRRRRLERLRRPPLRHRRGTPPGAVAPAHPLGRDHAQPAQGGAAVLRL
ncbi:tRNA adenylyltransferase [Arthrobacter sp. V4I6]|nr:tRNA adenylyltransferase [Arthrobacter sp. V4I6]